ncbi:MAG: hypothetical protein V4719_23100 [Planctomycetota bacterium]
MTTTEPKICPKCRGTMECGHTKAYRYFGDTAIGAELRDLKFVVAGIPTSWNPVQAFTQGLSREPQDRTYRVLGFRCSDCGYLELYANDNSDGFDK